MFDNLKGMGQIAGLMKDLPRIKAKMEEVKAELADLECTAETGGGAVTARVNGQMKLLGLEIDPSLMQGLVDANDPADRALANDLIVGAVNAAMEKARDTAAETMQAAANELGLPLPPGGLGGLLS